MTPADDAVERPDTEGAAGRAVAALMNWLDRSWRDRGTGIDNEIRALLAERDSLLARVRKLERLEAAIKVKGGTEHAPTEDAYLAACNALHTQRSRAEAAEALNARLVAALEPLAIVKHVRMAEGGGTVPTGGHCRLCNAEWNRNDAPRHVPDCLVAAAVLAEAKKEMTP